MEGGGSNRLSKQICAENCMTMKNIRMREGERIPSSPLDPPLHDTDISNCTTPYLKHQKILYFPVCNLPNNHVKNKSKSSATVAVAISYSSEGEEANCGHECEREFCRLQSK